MGCSSSKDVIAPIGAAGKAVGGAVDHINPFTANGDPNSRCCMMLRQAGEVATRLKAGQKQLQALNTSAQAALEGSKSLLDGPVPQTFASAEETSAVLAQAPKALGGPAYDSVALSKAKADLGANVQAQGLAPVEQWLAKYNAAEASQKAVNKAFDDIAAAKKKVASLQARAEGLRADPAKAQKLAEAQSALHEAEGKLTAATAKHTELEAAQYQAVAALNTEAPATLSGAVRAVMEQAGLALLAARDAIGVASVAGADAANGGAAASPPAATA